MPARDASPSLEHQLDDGRTVLVHAHPPDGASRACTFIGGVLDGETLDLPGDATYVRAAEPGGAGAVKYVPADGALWRVYVEPRDDRVLEG